MSRSPDRAVIAAALVLAGSLAVFGAALLRAAGTDTTTLQTLPDSDTAAAPAGDDAQLSREGLMLAVDSDPFSADRQRPAERYRLPGDVEPPMEPPPLPPELPAFQLRGTIVDAVGDGSAALIQLEDGAPRLMSIGSALGGYRLTHVMPQAAIMSNDERELLLRVPEPERTVVVADDSRDSRRRRGDDDDDDERRDRAEEIQRQQVRQMMQTLERARQSGASAQVIEALERAIERRAGGGNSPTL